MAISFKKNKKVSSNIVVEALIIVLGFFGGYLFYSQVLSGNAVDIPAPPEIKANDKLESFKDIKKFGFDFFNNDYFKSLKLLSDRPVKPGETGKQDLFAPF